MMITTTWKSAALAALFVAGLATGAVGQAAPADPHHPDAAAGQPGPSPLPGEMAQPGQGMQFAPGAIMRARMMCQDMMGGGMMDPDMMGRGMMGQDMMDRPGMMGTMPMMGMRRHMMKFMFAIADTDGDGALSFEEITAIHKRIFDKVDANRDGKVTPEEIQSFMQN